MEIDDLNNFTTNTVPDVLEYDSNHTINYNQVEEEVYISTTENNQMGDDVYIPIKILKMFLSMQSLGPEPILVQAGSSDE